MSMEKTYRIGQIVPSSNTTMETEVPAMLQRAIVPNGVGFTFHSSRAPMKTVSKEELTAMNGHMTRCAGELSDARMDVIASACLVAIMCQGSSYHRETERSLREVCNQDGAETLIVTSAGALIEATKAIGAKKIAIITPYMKHLTDLVVGYIEAEGIEVLDSISLEIPDNLEVGARDPLALVEIVKKLSTQNVDAVVLSACVQMPSLAALDIVQKTMNVPVFSTAAATVFEILRALKLPTEVPAAGGLLSGQYGSAVSA
jgi:maleate isomerase